MPEVKTETEVKEEQPTAQKKKGMPPLVMKIGLLGGISLVAVIAAYMITLKVLKPMFAHSPQNTKQVEPAASEVKEKKAEPPAKEEHGKEEGEHGAGNSQFYTVENIVVNPAGTSGTRFLSCSVSFALSSQEDKKVYEGFDVQIRDLLITILSSKTVDELSEVSSRNQMRRQMLAVINKLTEPTKAQAVYLTDFVLQ